MDIDPTQGIGIRDVETALQDIFKGCTIRMPSSLGGSFHAEVSFYEYEVRVILSGDRAIDRKIHYRFLQWVSQPGNRKPTRRSIIEFETTDPEELWAGLDKTKMHLQSIVYAISKAMRPPTVAKMNSIDDLFRGG